MPKIAVGSVAEHHELRRRGILDAAVDVLGEGGVPALTPAAVAARTGLARNSIYQYHPSTGALVAAAVEESFRRAGAALARAVDTTAPADERLRSWLRAGLDAATAGHAAWRTEEFELPPECSDRVGELHAQMREPLVVALTDLGVADAGDAAELVAGMVQAGANQVRRGSDPEAVLERIVDLLALPAP